MSPRPRAFERKLKEYTLSPKFRLVVEHNPSALSAAVGFFVGRGSRHETSDMQGATHLAEHLFFKGTSEYSAEEISQKVERFGGDLNAYTDRELTCFHAWVPKDQLELSFEMITKMLFDSVFDKDEFEKEREVVVQELKGYEDSPDDEFWDALFETPWNGHPLGRRIGGFPRHVAKIGHSELMAHIREGLLSAPITIVVVSAHSPERVRRVAREALHQAKSYVWGDMLGVVKKVRRERPRMSARWVKASHVKRFKSADQIQLGFLFPSVDMSSQREVDCAALTTLLGSGSSSRLFREIRETRGLAYNTSLSLSSFSDTGLVVGHIVTDREKLFEAAAVAGEIFRELPSTLGAEDLEFVRSLLEGSLFMNYESVNNRMETLGRQSLLMNRVLDLREALGELKDLKLSTLRREARRLMPTPCFFALGPVGARDLPRIVASWEGKKQ